LDSDLGSSAGFEYALQRCESCGTYRMRVFFVGGVSRFETVTRSEADHMKSIPTGRELKTFLNRWWEDH
jgi:hypothetical protein